VELNIVDSERRVEVELSAVSHVLKLSYVFIKDALPDLRKYSWNLSRAEMQIICVNFYSDVSLWLVELVILFKP